MSSPDGESHKKPGPKPKYHVCSIAGCMRKPVARALCKKHYYRQARTGCTDDPHPPSLEERFWEKVDKSGEHWLWTAHCDKDGYGRFTVKHHQPIQAHRMAFILTYGPIPKDKPHILHKCDIHACVRPSCLRAGTTQENTQDMIQKGRKPRGEQSARARLTNSDVVRIRELYATGAYTCKQLGDMFLVAKSNVQAVVSRTTWRHLP